MRNEDNDIMQLNGFLVFNITVSVFCAVSLLRVKTEKEAFFPRTLPKLFPEKRGRQGGDHMVTSV